MEDQQEPIRKGTRLVWRLNDNHQILTPMICSDVNNVQLEYNRMTHEEDKCIDQKTVLFGSSDADTPKVTSISQT